MDDLTRRTHVVVRLARRIRRLALTSSRRWWIGGAAVVMLGAVLLGRDDFMQMARSFAGADWRWVTPALAMMLASLALRSLALALIVDALGAVRVRVRDAFSATSIGLLANSLIPVKVGTILTPCVLHLLLRRRGAKVPFATILGVTLTERMFAIAGFLALSLVFLGALDVPAWAVHVLWVGAGVIAAAFVAGAVFAHRSGWVARECAGGGTRLRRAGRWLPQLVESQRIMTRPLLFAEVSGVQVLSWLLQLAAATAMLWAFHLDAAGLRAAALVLVLTNLIGLVAATPGNVGTFQVAAVAALSAYGVEAGPALAYALGLQALQLLVAIVAGLAALAAQDLSLRDLAGRSRQATASLKGVDGAVTAEDPLA